MKLLLFASCFVLAFASSVLELTEDSFDSAILESGKPALVEFYADWCGHCKTLAPIYDQLADTFAYRQKDVKIAKINADVHRSIGLRYGIQGFPTLKWFDGKSKDPVDYSMGRSLEQMSAFVTEKTGIKAKVSKAEASKVVVLKDSNFDDVVLDSSVDALVEFYAPWCGHCKTLAPIYEKVAADYADEHDIVIAKLDATDEASRATAEKYGITSFPQLKFFSKHNKEPEDYMLGRTEADLLVYLNDKTGKFRVVGGGLSELAGRVPELDAVAQKLASGKGSVEDMLREAKVVAKAVASKSANYYIRIMEKLAETTTYVNDEIERLERVLSNGRLAKSKEDDFQIRKNILAMFQGTRDRDEL